MRKGGVYVIRGTKGTRIGQSADVPRRIAKVLTEHGQRTDVLEGLDSFQHRGVPPSAT